MVKLYGFMPGIIVPFASGNEIEYSAMPSDELIGDLHSIREGGVVGIQYFEDLHRGGKILKQHELTHDMKDGSPGYWQALMDAEYGRLRFSFLDDAGFHKEFLDNMDASKRRLAFSQDPLISRKRKIEYMAKAYESAVEASYIGNVLVVQKIIRKLMCNAHDAAVLDSFFADIIFSRRDEIELEIISYDRDEISANDMPSEGNQIKSRISRDAVPSVYALAAYETSKRKYRALKTGRVVDHGEPTFIGTLETDVPPAGLFEMHAEQEGTYIHGSLEDVSGSATFVGNIRNGGIRFSAIYGRNAIANGMPPTPVDFEGEDDEEGFTGTYTANGTKRPFWMKRFSRS